MKESLSSANFIPNQGSDTKIPISTDPSYTKTTPFHTSLGELMDLVDTRDTTKLSQLGGISGLVTALCSDSLRGLSQQTTLNDNKDSLEHRRSVFGVNHIPDIRQRSLLGFLWDALHDKTLIVLIIASIVSLGLGLYKDLAVGNGQSEHGYSWMEGLAIMVSVLIVTFVNALNDYQKEKQFRKLNAKKENRLIKVVRDENKVQISIHDVVVGDVVILEPGDIVCADGVIINSHGLSCDESGATGESDAVKKGLGPRLDPFILSGTKVLEGMGRCLVIAVGPHSFNGKLFLSLRMEKEDTPLQIKLDTLAEKIAKLGAALSLTMLLCLIMKYVIVEATKENGFGSAVDVGDALTAIFIESITLLVVAVPEGLPMAVTMALAFATSRMLRDNNLVRVLAACETMGGATTICSDKTGTLTTNVMTCVRGRIAQVECESPHALIDFIRHRLEESVKDPFVQGICVNSTAFHSVDVSSGKAIPVGSKTEIALLNLVKESGVDYKLVRQNTPIVHLYPFSSIRKLMSVIVSCHDEDRYRQYVKGAPEIILGYCTHYMDNQRAIMSMENTSFEEDMTSTITHMADQGLRTLALAYIEYSPSELELLDLEKQPPLANLTWLGVVGIEDPIRPEVPEAVRLCQKAGIFVRMVTGDNMATATSIAKKCNILMRGGLVLEGPRFRKLDDATLTALIPRLQVLARSSPSDKQILVRKLKEMNEVVAVTGDGTNDGPALKTADVGFSMGITGTEVAKEASSIILMDDRFSSIVKAVSWGRCVNDSVRKFLQFQLTVNVTAVLVTFESAMVDTHGQSALNAVQLLWVNMLMDTMGALALATDSPTPDLLDRSPEPKHRGLVTFDMWKMILGQATFQTIVCLIMLHFGAPIFHLHPETSIQDAKCLRTIVFNLFVFLQLFNELNCRRLGSGIGSFNVFAHFFHNWIFILVLLVSILGQVMIVCFGGMAFDTVPLPWWIWALCVLIGALNLPVGMIIRLIPDLRSPKPPERIVMSKERLQWQAAIIDVKHGLSVFSALRRPPVSVPVNIVVSSPSLLGGTAGAAASSSYSPPKY